MAWTARAGRLRSPGVRRITAYLRTVLWPGPHGPASLAVVPVDDVRIPALCLTSLAVSCAQQGKRVVVVDLCPGAPAARLLGVKRAGVEKLSVHGADLMVAVPDPDNDRPTGPLASTDRQGEHIGAFGLSADVLLTLAALDPAVGAEHLPEWASAVVAVVTAGRSSAARVHAVGEMLRLAGISRFSAVVVGADKADESLGVTRRSKTPTGSADAVTEGVRSGLGDPFVRARREPNGVPIED